MINKCYKCDLCSTRKNIVNGYGSKESIIMFIGEAPGYHEDKEGYPFVGKAGQELDKYLSLLNLTKDEIYITNAVKCRPPANRIPTLFECLSCRTNLYKEFIEIKPKMCIFLGNTSISTFFNPYYNFSSIRNRPFKLGNTIFIMIYHPSHLLYNPNKTDEYIKTFKLIGKLYQYYKINHILNY